MNKIELQRILNYRYKIIEQIANITEKFTEEEGLKIFGKETILAYNSISLKDIYEKEANIKTETPNEYVYYFLKYLLEEFDFQFKIKEDKEECFHCKGGLDTFEDECFGCGGTGQEIVGYIIDGKKVKDIYQ